MTDIATTQIGIIPIPSDEISHLLARCLNGEQLAYDAVYDRFATDIYRLCFNLLQDQQDAEEVLQDAFEYAFRRLSTYKSEKSAFRTWLYRIAISRCRNKRRRKWLPSFSLNSVEGDIIKDDQAPAPLELAELNEQQKMIWQAVGQLSPKLRETAILRYYNAMPYNEIGQILDIPPKTAESRMRLAHKALKKLLVEEDCG